MRKIYIFLFLLSIFLCGCNKHLILNINTNNISSILYEGEELSSNDFEDIMKKINNITFYNLYDVDVTGKKLIVISKDHDYNFEILDNYILYIDNNQKYYTQSSKVSNYIRNLLAKYNDTDFFDIVFTNEYDTNNSDYLIKLDNTNNYIIIKPKTSIYNFKIINNELVSSAENKIDKIEDGKELCIQTANYKNIIISFNNPYDYRIDVTYNNGFNIDIKKDAKHVS